MKTRSDIAVWSGALFAVMAVPQAYGATSCEKLTAFHAANVKVTEANTVDTLSGISPTLAQASVSAPFCRVGGFLTPSKDSHVGFEVWLPQAGAWNHKLLAVGNGGLSGALNYRALPAGLNRGYATMTTDLGHTNNPPNAGEDATWALGHPEKVVDYAYRAEHVSTLAAKQIIDAYYGGDPAHSYYTGCSAGGIQGMTELLRFPQDFDGYIIGDATPDHLGQEMAAFWNTLVASLADSANALRAPQIQLVHKEILRQCAGKDGGTSSDPFLTDPTACQFEPKAVQCTAQQDPSSCLTPMQVGMFNKIYQGPVNPRTHEAILSGLTPGTELGWDKYFVGKTNPVGAERPWAGFLTSIVYSDPEWLTQQKYLSFDFDKDYTAARQKIVAGESLESSWNTRNRDIDAFGKKGGKVIHYHGWDDPNIPALEAVRFFTSVVADQAKRHRITAQHALEATQQVYRLFMVPGMGHCMGGEGPTSFGQNGQKPLKADPEYDTLIALEQWVEKGVAPEKFIGSRVDAKTGAVDMTRPICAYPKLPVWNGSGTAADASNFACAAGPRRQGARVDLTMPNSSGVVN
jgi:feruloyl esterase